MPAIAATTGVRFRHLAQGAVELLAAHDGAARAVHAQYNGTYRVVGRQAADGAQTLLVVEDDARYVDLRDPLTERDAAVAPHGGKRRGKQKQQGSQAPPK